MARNAQCVPVWVFNHYLFELAGESIKRAIGQLLGTRWHVQPKIANQPSAQLLVGVAWRKIIGGQALQQATVPFKFVAAGVGFRRVGAQCQSPCSTNPAQ